jgi:hypothetical protein
VSVAVVDAAPGAGESPPAVFSDLPAVVPGPLDAFSYRPSGAHSIPAGDLRADLIAELTMFRQGMERQRLGRALAVPAALTTSIPELAAIRDRLVAEGPATRSSRPPLTCYSAAWTCGLCRNVSATARSELPAVDFVFCPWPAGIFA